MPASGAAAARAPRRLAGIGQVLAELSPEFPDLSPSKLRFLEEQGLVSPSRTPAGYRKFSRDDVERLRTVLTLQRDRYLPLRVIREQLADRDAGLTPPAQARAAGLPTMLSTGRRYTREELAEAAGADPELVAQAISASLLKPAENHGDDDLVILVALVALGAGGIEPRHLRGYRAAADRDAGLVESALAPALRRPDASGRARAAESARDLVSQLETVRAALVRASTDRWAE